MKPYKIALKNIKKSFKDYAIYFFTLILGVAIFYVFNAIESQTVLIEASKSTRSIISLMNNVLSGVSVFVSFILGFLIIYASRFLMKRRNKEFGIYLTLGMSKRSVSYILLFETIFIGIISLLVGLGLGALLSQLMSIVVANSFEANLTKFTFVFSSSACIKTLIYFAIMYLFVMIFNTISISKCKLIDLLHASKRSEKVKLKNPFICIIVFIISSIMLGYAYYLVTGGINALDSAAKIFKPIILGAVSSFLILWSVSGLVLKIVQSSKKFYYKNLNSFILRQISSKINTTVMSMTIICLMLFVTICVLSSSLSIKNSMTDNLTKLVPMDVQIYKDMNLTDNEKYSEERINDSKLDVLETLEKLDFNYNSYYQDVIDINVYRNDITLRTTLGSALENAKKMVGSFFSFDIKEDFIKLSDYNKIARAFNLDTFTLKDNEYLIVADFDSFVAMRNLGLKENTPININGVNYYPKYQECQNGFIYISSQHINMGLIVVPDEALNEARLARNIMTANYKVKDKDETKEFDEKLQEVKNHPYFKNTSLDATTKNYLYESSVGLGAMVTFIGLYLGVIFLISSAAVLALKELSESSDNKERYNILRRIGTDEKLINKALFKQIAIFFLIPLILAIIHSIFGIKFCTIILESFGNDTLLPSIIMTAVILIFIYGGYFLITYFCSKNMIKKG